MISSLNLILWKEEYCSELQVLQLVYMSIHMLIAEEWCTSIPEILWTASIWFLICFFLSDTLLLTEFTLVVAQGQNYASTQWE